MKILLINEVCGVTSTGSICADLAEYLMSRGHEVRVLYGRMDAPERCSGYGVRIAGKYEVALNALEARLFDNCGLAGGIVGRHGSGVGGTGRAIEFIREFEPDVVHLHNLHGYYINYKLLFEELARLQVPVIQTLHDCWALTGHCAYFDNAGCDKWKTGCGNCPQKGEYPKSILLDRSKRNLEEKVRAYGLLKNLRFVVPSKWLGEIVEESRVGRSVGSTVAAEVRVDASGAGASSAVGSTGNVVVIPNGIDSEVFAPREGNYFARKGITDKKVVLGVASLWEPRKGLDYFIELASRLPDEYRIVLVGVRDEQKKLLPANISTIARTFDRKELASIYSSAYVYLNPTLEDNYPTTNLEAICCGTPVITFDTGGSPESAQAYGIVCEKSVNAILEAIDKVESLYDSALPAGGLEAIREQFSSRVMFARYETLYCNGVRPH